MRSTLNIYLALAQAPPHDVGTPRLLLVSHLVRE